MADTGAKYSGTVVSTGSWSNFTTAKLGANDADRATTAATSSDSGVLRNFDFSAIPAGSTINGIVVEADLRSSSAAYTAYLKARISKNAGSAWSAYTADQSVKSTTDSTKTYGGSSDLWGLTISAAEVKDTANFYVEVAGYISNSKGTCEVDFVTTTVYYTAPTAHTSTLTDALTLARATIGKQMVFSKTYTDALGLADSINVAGNDWQYRVKITVLATKVDADLTDFPVYVDLANLPAEFHAHVNQTDARDIRVTKSDGTTEIPREVVFYDADTNTGELHFKGDILDGTNVDFYIYYGNAGATEPAVDSDYGRNNVWTSFGSVLHLNESSGEPIESSGKVSATNEGDLPDAKTGKIYNGQDFDGNGDYIELANDSDLDCANQTISFWLKADSLETTNRCFYARRTETTSGEMIFHYTTSTDTINWDTIGSTKRWNTGYKPPTDGSIVLLHFTWDGSVKRLYVNGSLQSNSASDAHTLLNANSVARIGVDTISLQYYVDGVIDEFRLSGTKREAEWISTEYNNQSSPNTFYSVGEEEEEWGFSETLTDALSLVNPAIAKASIFSKTITKTLSLIDSTTKTQSLSKSFSDIIQLTDSVSKKISKTIADILSLGEAFLKSTGLTKALTDAISLVDSVAADLTTSLEEHSETLTDVLSLNDAASKLSSFAKTITSVLSLNDAITKASSFAKTITKTLSLNESVERVAGFKKTLTDALSLNDTTDIIRQFVSSLTEALSLNDAIAKASSFAKTITSSLSLADAVSVGRQYVQSLIDVVYLSPQEVEGYAETIVDALSLNDAVTRLSTFSHIITDVITLVDSVVADATQIIEETLVDALSLSDSLLSLQSLNKSLTGTISLSDALSKLTAFTKTITKAISLTDVYTSVEGFSKSLTDAISLNEVFSKLTAFTKTITKAISLNESLSKSISLAKSFADVISLSDAVSFAGGNTQLLLDSLSLTDSLSRLQTLGKSIADEIDLSEAISKASSWSKTYTDVVTIVDLTVSFINEFADTLLESISLADTMTKTLSMGKIITKTLTLKDILMRKIFFELTREEDYLYFGISGYEKQGQTISFSSDTQIKDIDVMMYKYGSPTDEVILEVYTDGTGEPGTLLATADNSINGSTLSEGWANRKICRFSFNSPVSISSGTTYWLVLSRTGSVDSDNFYYVTSANVDVSAEGLTEVWDMVLQANHDGQESTAIWYINDGVEYPKLWHQYTGATFDPPDPLAFEVSTYADLKKVGTGTDGWNLSSSYVLANDIDASASQTENGGSGWDPIGTWGSEFTGTFDGQGHTISGLYINRVEEAVGLFHSNNGTIKNLYLEIESSSSVGNSGGIVGENNGTVSGCYVLADIECDGNNAGGVIGLNNGTVNKCYSSGTITSTVWGAGGLVGQNNSGTIENSYSIATVNGDDTVGGLCGYNQTGIIRKCYSAGAVSGTSDVGGFCGSENTGGSYDTQDNFFDYQTAGNETEIGATKKTTAQMKDMDTFASFSLDPYAGGESYYYSVSLLAWTANSYSSGGYTYCYDWWFKLYEKESGLVSLWAKTLTNAISLNEVKTLSLNMAKSFVDTISLSDTFSFLFKFGAVLTETLTLSESLAARGWGWLTKKTSSWIYATKNSSVWTEATKHSSSWTNATKNTSSWTNQSKNTSNWTWQDKNK